MQRTPFYEKHLQSGGKMIDFYGWQLPVQYEGILEEHQAVRTRAGIFDVSHMGELWVEGPQALDNLQRIVTNDLEPIRDGQVAYSPMCRPDGGIIDDLLIYRLSFDRWLLVVNAANIAKDEAWLRENLTGDATLVNRSEETALLAVQGPAAQEILQQLTLYPLEQIRQFRFRDQVELAAEKILISRTGYTGEDGFELYLKNLKAADLWDSILQAGESYGLVPAGLGARDTLRFEAALPLYGQDLTDEISPLEAGLARFVHFDKGDFLGRDALVKQKTSGVKRQRIGLTMVDRGVPRAGFAVSVGGETVGTITSGTFAPTLKQNCALALVNTPLPAIGAEVKVNIRGRSLTAHRTALPFYRRK